ncbi:KAP family NTPase [Clostridium gasigenes]|uniref:P-loop NTPase fold protein n=1 Tax=Clostridium gasigenes TaxID=94869 RepID=UPI001C0C6B1D|nr:P-loop NTPase fold protein [Clostridium gasigenes]MBU3133362.1 KAP family NTPase [Clostridium gasigenes]
MNNVQAKNVLNRIFDEENTRINYKQCILVDGPWGIGKTHFIQNYFSENKEKYELVYITVFGKKTVKDVEKSILINLLPGFKNFDKQKGIGKTMQEVLKDMSQKFLGINIENYINSFSIEDIPSILNENKHKIICFDDIERKSDSIEMKDLLGLIERTKSKFDVIIIGNLDEIEKNHIEIFNRYKEKVIDNTITINNFDRDTLKSVLKNMKVENMDIIIDVYLSDNTSFGKKLNCKTFLVERVNNLRIFMKYVELIVTLERYLAPYSVEKEVAKICKTVIYNHYFPSEDKEKNSMNFDKFNIYKTIKKVLLNEDIERDEFREYFIANSEIRKDIESIYSAYTLNETQFNELINKIYIKIKNSDLEYFIKQKNVIQLISALNEVEIINNDIVENLFIICIELYSPENYKAYEKINYLEWNSSDDYGNEIGCDKTTREFIEKINQKCEEKFNQFINSKYEEAMYNKEYEEIIKIASFNSIKKIEDFEEIFDNYFDELNMDYSNEVDRKIHILINRTKSDIISDFFSKRIKTEKQITKIKKYECFDFILEQKIQAEDQAEYYENNPVEEYE